MALKADAWKKIDLAADLFKTFGRISRLKHAVRWLYSVVALLLISEQSLQAARLEILEVPGFTLRVNPLGDPVERHLAVFSPDETKAATPMPMVVYLPGWGGSSEDAIAQGRGAWFGQVVDRLAADGLPLRVAIVDCRSRYGGSQYLNSAATGNYSDYVADEVLPLLKVRYSFAKEGALPCIIAGHSSGGYGALMLAISRHAQFAAVVALSPDSDFETTHKPLVTQPSVRAITRADLDAVMAPPGRSKMPGDGLARLVMGLCANYASTPAKPGQFEWLYDDRGEWRQQAWQRWIDLDPLTIVKRDADAFAPSQRVYLDGAEQDEFGANIGARKIYEALKSRASAATFYEPPGHHGDHLPERLERGLSWAFGMAVQEIAPTR